MGSPSVWHPKGVRVCVCMYTHMQDHSLIPLPHFHFHYLSHMQKLYSGGDYSVRTDDGQAISHWVESFSKNPQKATVSFSLSSSYPPPPPLPPCLHEVLVFPPTILRLLPSSSKASGRLTLWGSLWQVMTSLSDWVVSISVGQLSLNIEILWLFLVTIIKSSWFL